MQDEDERECGALEGGVRAATRAAALSPDLVLASCFVMAALAEDVVCGQNDVSNFCRGWKML